MDSHRTDSNAYLLEIGPFVVNLNSPITTVKNNIYELYSEYPEVNESCFVDYYIELKPPSFLRSVFRPQVDFSLEGFSPFKPLPITDAYPLFEWGMNWCIASQAHQYLMLHAATLEKNGQVLILPAPPGSGKSTLCALLNHSGWRLMSDEFALYDLKTHLLHPLVRPISLKNESIDILRSFSSKVEIGSLVKGTAKGTVAHIKPLSGCVQQAKVSAKPAWIVLPRFQAKSKTLVSLPQKADFFMKMIENAFNYSELGEVGFWAAKELIDQCDCYSLIYSDIDEALVFFDGLSREKPLG